MTKQMAVISLEARGGAPEWIRMLARGQVMLGDGRGPFTVDQEALAQIVAAWRERGNDLVIDYEHQTLDGGPAPAAGWIKALEARDDGLWARVEWTEKAQEFIANREYRYFSPVVVLDEQQRPMELLHAALTNVPAINNLTPLSAKYGEGLTTVKPAAAQGIKNTEGQKMVKSILKALGLPEDAGEERVLACVNQHTQIAAGLGELREALGLPAEAGLPQIKGAVLALKQGGDALHTVQQELAALRAERAREKAAASVTAALTAGKLAPTQREWALKYATDDPEGFAAFAAQAPVVVPMARLPEGPDKPPVSETPTDDELAMCRLMDVDPAVFKQQQKQATG